MVSLYIQRYGFIVPLCEWYSNFSAGAKINDQSPRAYTGVEGGGDEVGQCSLKYIYSL